MNKSKHLLISGRTTAGLKFKLNIYFGTTFNSKPILQSVQTLLLFAINPLFPLLPNTLAFTFVLLTNSHL